MIALLLTGLLLATSSAPTFEKFPVPSETIEAPKVDLKSHPIGSKFRTVITDTVKSEGANFAGHFTIATWGCGTNCSLFAIIDLRTGQISHNPNRILPRGLEYRVDSSLLILNPRLDDGFEHFPEVPTTYCVWDGKRLNKIGENSGAR
jgi:hypothetical protein